ncbi:MAG: alkene reductase [Pseudomonadota bacterium]
MPDLFDPVTFGSIHAKNRVFMAPLTRTRGTREHVPNEMMAEYYAQRAGAGLIVSEAIGVSQQGLGLAFATGLWRDDQVRGWRRVTDEVHSAGGKIIAQIWHMGRMVHPIFVNGELPVSSSETCAPGRAHTYEGRAPFVTSRSLERSEIPALLEDYRHAARNAMDAGFDGIQIHAANGYLIDQFLRNNANFRKDEYGGSVQNRARLLKEITEALVDTVGPAQTSVRLSPNGDTAGVNDSDPKTLFLEVAKMLDDYNLAFLELREMPKDGTLGHGDHDPLAPMFRENFSGPLVLNSDLTLDKARDLLATGAADAVSFGRLFVSNPDLPRRFKEGIPLAPFDKSKFYGQSAEGYTDYPAAP